MAVPLRERGPGLRRRTLCSRFVALFHRATLEPSKEEIIADWVPRHAWGPASGTQIEVIGSYRFDDPDGRVGMEAFLARADGHLLHVPLTYRDAPLDDGPEGALITTMQHSVLGTRWVYDGLQDPIFLMMLAAVSMTGQGEALGMAVYDGRWYVAPTNVRIAGGGWTMERVPVDGFTMGADDGDVVTLANDGLEVRVWRRPLAGDRPPIGMVATWNGQQDPVVLTEVRNRRR